MIADLSPIGLALKPRNAKDHQRGVTVSPRDAPVSEVSLGGSLAAALLLGCRVVAHSALQNTFLARVHHAGRILDSRCFAALTALRYETGHPHSARSQVR